MKKRLLIADDTKGWKEKILKAKKAQFYRIEFAKDSKECWKKIQTFKPDLVLLRLMLPDMHAIEILKKIKEKTNIGVIIVSSKILIQDYHAAIEEKADYFFPRHWKIDVLFALIAKFFEHTLKPPSFSSIIQKTCEKTKIYAPTLSTTNSFIKFWGTRGSITVAGAQYSHYGGNTSCLEIRQNKQLIIFDAGTGIRSLGAEILKTDIKTIHLFLGHTHWDHILGFPFFEPLYQSGYKIHIYSPKGFGRKTKDLLTDLLAYDFFPIRLDEVEAKLYFHEINEQKPVQISKNLAVYSHHTFHPGLTYCFKLKTSKTTFGYVTDNECFMGYHGHPGHITTKHPLLTPHKELIAFLSECDFLIHEAQYTPKEYLQKVGWGHSSITNATILFKFLKIPEWIVTHHDPAHTDQDIIKKILLHKKILDECKIKTHVTYAFDELALAL